MKDHLAWCTTHVPWPSCGFGCSVIGETEHPGCFACEGLPAVAGNGVLKARTPLPRGMSDEEDESIEETEAAASAEEAPAADTESDEEPDDQSDGEDANEESGLAEGDFVRLAYTARSVDSDQLVDTTDVEIAEEEGVDTENQSFEPRVIALGAGHLFPSVESDITGKEVGETGTVEVPPHEAFGEYDPENVRTVSAETIPEDDRYPGAQVEIDGEHGFVETIIGGRARVDFNHPLAGESIEYEYEILEQIEDRLEQAQGMLSTVVDVDLEMWIETDTEEQPAEEADEEEEPATEEVELETLYIESVPQLTMNQQWMFQKRQLVQEIIDRLGVDRVIVQETIEGGPMAPPGMGDVQSAIEDADVDAEELAEELGEDLEE